MSSALENFIFQNQPVPQGVTILTKIMPDITETQLNSLLKLVFDTLQKKSMPAKSLEKTLKKMKLSEHGDHLFCGLFMLIQSLLRLPLDNIKMNDLKQSLKELKFTEECCSEFISLFQENKSDLYLSRSLLGFGYFQRLENFNWRIDISISSNFLAKSLDTIIIFQMNLSNGESKTFEVSIAKFHQLRFYVSTMLKELEYIEKKSVFKT